MHHAVRKFLGRKQFERNGSLLRFNQRYAFADEDRNDMDAEFVGLSFVQKRSDDLATSHDPNVLTGLRRKRCANGLIGSFTSSNPGNSDRCGGGKRGSS